MVTGELELLKVVSHLSQILVVWSRRLFYRWLAGIETSFMEKNSPNKQVTAKWVIQTQNRIENWVILEVCCLSSRTNLFHGSGWDAFVTKFL